MSKRNKNRTTAPNPPATRQTTLVSSETSLKESISWSGPIPPPSALQGYENIIPGSANRILEMAEKQTEHRIELEKIVIQGDTTRSYVGLIAGFILSAMVIVGGIYLISTGHDWAGGVLVGLDLVGLASVFVYGSRSRRAEREQKSSETTPPQTPTSKKQHQIG